MTIELVKDVIGENLGYVGTFDVTTLREQLPGGVEAPKLYPYVQRLERLRRLPILTNDIDTIIKTIESSRGNVSQQITYDNSNLIYALDQNLKSALSYLLYTLNEYSTKQPDEALSLKLPDTQTFSDLEKISRDLKLAIEIPINDQNAGGRVEILAAEKGSIVVIITVLVIPAIRLISDLFKKAAEIRTEIAKREAMIAFTKKYTAETTFIETLTEKVKQDNIKLTHESAAQIIADNYDLNGQQPDAEQTKRMQTALDIAGELVEQGLEITPKLTNIQARVMMPDFKKLRNGIIEQKTLPNANNELNDSEANVD